MEDQVTPQQFIVFLFALACGGLLSAMYWYWAFEAGPVAWLLAVVRSVKGLFTNVMSRSENKPAAEPLSSKDGQSAGRTDSTTYDRAELLTFYTLLRKYGVPREEARPVLKLIRVPLSNDVWAKAQPPEPEQLTPIAGRPTDADFPYEPIGQ